MRIPRKGIEVAEFISEAIARLQHDVDPTTARSLMEDVANAANVDNDPAISRRELRALFGTPHGRALVDSLIHHKHGLANLHAIDLAARLELPSSATAALEAFRLGRSLFIGTAGGIGLLATGFFVDYEIGRVTGPITRIAENTELLHGDMTDLRGEIHGDLTDLRGGIHGDLTDLRGEIQAINSKLDPLTTNLGKMEVDIRNLDLSLQTQMTLLLEQIAPIADEMKALDKSLRGNLGAVSGNVKKLSTSVRSIGNSIDGLDQKAGAVVPELVPTLRGANRWLHPFGLFAERDKFQQAPAKKKKNTLVTKRAVKKHEEDYRASSAAAGSTASLPRSSRTRTLPSFSSPAPSPARDLVTTGSTQKSGIA